MTSPWFGLWAAQLEAEKGAADNKQYLLGAVGERKDGAIVSSRNGATSGVRIASAHAEARVCRKLDKGANVFVARITRGGQWALARPCGSCLVFMKARGVRFVYYTIGPDEYGVIDVLYFLGRK